MDLISLEGIATVISIAGSFVLALNKPFSKWGWVIFLASNILWFSFGVQHGYFGLCVTQIAFSISSLIGIYKSFNFHFLNSKDKSYV